MFLQVDIIYTVKQVFSLWLPCTHLVKWMWIYTVHQRKHASNALLSNMHCVDWGTLCRGWNRFATRPCVAVLHNLSWVSWYEAVPSNHLLWPTSDDNANSPVHQSQDCVYSNGVSPCTRFYRTYYCFVLDVPTVTTVWLYYVALHCVPKNVALYMSKFLQKYRTLSNYHLTA